MVRVLFESIIYFCTIKLTSLDFLEVQHLDATPSFLSTTVRLLNVFKNCPLCVLQKNLSVAKNEILLCCRKVSTFILIEGIEILEEEDSSLAAKLFLIEKFFSVIFCNFWEKIEVSDVSSLANFSTMKIETNKNDNLTFFRKM